MGTSRVAHIAVMSGDPDFCALVHSIVADESTIVCEIAMDWVRPHGVGMIGAPDLIVIDSHIAPDAYGAMRRVRRRCLTSIILVAGVENERRGAHLLDQGADTVSFAGSPMFPALLRALTRHARALSADTRLAFGDLILDREHRRVWSAGRRLSLSSREYDVLNCLFFHAPRPVGRETLTDFVWSPEDAPTPNAIEVYVSYLRRKLSAGSKVAINTVRGVGYALAVLTPPME